MLLCTEWAYYRAYLKEIGSLARSREKKSGRKSGEERRGRFSVALKLWFISRLRNPHIAVETPKSDCHARNDAEGKTSRAVSILAWQHCAKAAHPGYLTGFVPGIAARRRGA
jgi:hypothetical protein